MGSYYSDTIKDALYPQKRGTIKINNKYLVPSAPKAFNAKEIKKLRVSLSLSVAVFAAVLNVSPKTVEAWESGKNTPSGASQRLLQMISKNPDIILEGGALLDYTALK